MGLGVVDGNVLGCGCAYPNCHRLGRRCDAPQAEGGGNIVRGEQLRHSVAVCGGSACGLIRREGGQHMGYLGATQHSTRARAQQGSG